MKFKEIFRKNLTCDNITSHKKSGLHPLSRKHSFRKTTAPHLFNLIHPFNPRILLTLFTKKPPTSFSSVTSTSVGINPKNFLTFSSKRLPH